jgi:hypothetical protein
MNGAPSSGVCALSEGGGPGHGLVPRLLLPSAVGVEGRPAHIGVITGAAAPTISTTFPAL